MTKARTQQDRPTQITEVSFLALGIPSLPNGWLEELVISGIFALALYICML
jgi:hypothetical protein